MDANYKNARLSVSYEIDNLRLGAYSLGVLDASAESVFSSAVDPKDSRIVVGIDLPPQETYSVIIRWKEEIIGSSPLLISSTEHAGSSFDRVTVTGSVVRPDRPEAWLASLINQPPEKVAGETLFRLATLKPHLLRQHSVEQLERLWQPLGRMAEIHRSTFEPLPTWPLINKALLMVTKQATTYTVYPERIAWRGLQGIGKIYLSTPQEGEIIAYARWTKKRLFSSRLRVRIPAKDPANAKFSELEERDMWPAYYDRSSGKFHGMRSRAMIPGLDRANGTYLADCAHEYTLIVRNRQAKTPLKHAFSPAVSIDRRYAQALFQRAANQKPDSQHAQDITSAVGYRRAVAEWYSDFVDDVHRRTQLRALADIANPAGKLSNFIIVAPLVLAKHNETLISSGLRFIGGMERQIQTDSADHMMRLDRHILALSMILRSYSLKRQSTRRDILRRINMENDQLIELLESANRVCPSLLEWALTWSEIFIVHGSS